MCEAPNAHCGPHGCNASCASFPTTLPSTPTTLTDLKKENVLLKSERRDRRGYVCKLGDFGLSRCGQGVGVDGDPRVAAVLAGLVVDEC